MSRCAAAFLDDQLSVAGGGFKQLPQLLAVNVMACRHKNACWYASVLCSTGRHADTHQAGQSAASSLQVVPFSRVHKAQALGTKPPPEEEVRMEDLPPEELTEQARAVRIANRDSLANKSRARRANKGQSSATEEATDAPDQVAYVEPEADTADNTVYQATVVASKTCVLLMVSAVDLLRFGRSLKLELQELAWQRQQGLRDRIDTLLTTHRSLDSSLHTARRFISSVPLLAQCLLPPIWQISQVSEHAASFPDWLTARCTGNLIEPAGDHPLMAQAVGTQACPLR